MIGIAVLLSTFAWALPAGARAADSPVAAYGSLATIRPDRALPSGGASSISIMAARNEYQSAQIAVSAGQTPLQGIGVGMGTTLTGPGGATISNDQVSFYREAYYTVHSASDDEGEVGQWPDALIPERDAFYGEDRNAFPVDVPASSRVAAWIDVLVPTEAPAGVYTGTIVVSQAGGVLSTVPINVKVVNFTLPSTSTLSSSFPISSYAPCTAHTGNYACRYDEDERWQLAKLYAEAGLNNRVTISNPFPGAYGDSGEPEAPVSGAAREKFEEYILPMIEGNDPDVQLTGAKLTSILAYGECARAGSSCLAGWKQLATQYGFADRFSLYLCDEPYWQTELWESECKPNAARAEQVWPSVDKLITTDIQDTEGNQALDDVDTLVPVINQMADKAGELAGNQRPAYNSFLGSNAGGGPSNKLWIYTSCLSYGCGESASTPYSNGWAGYAIDQPAAEAEATGWLAFDYGATGELYYNSGRELQNAWSNQYYAGGNGDGDLFYAGTPDGVDPNSIAIGGERDIPIESMRLKRIRDGREAYEYLHILETRGEGEQAKGVVSNVFGPLSSATFGADVSQKDIDGARERLAQMITRELSVRLISLKVPHDPTRLRRQGIRALVSCTASCTVNVTPVLSANASGRLGVRSRLGRTSARLGANHRRWVRVRVRGSIGRKIAGSVRPAAVRATVKAQPLSS